MKKKVFVGLSGGVDSSVSALVLKQAGYDVTGVYIKGWQPDWIPCTWKDDRISALRTAAHLDIPFVTLDLEQKYKQKVVNYILSEYEKGNTPNPDMLCNREIKFGEFLKWSVAMGADYVATGHYAQIAKSNLFESNDKEKDQSYFLSQLTQEQIKKIIFPIGHFQKSQVRKIAAENNLPVAGRKDSQGVCFVGDLEMKDFLKRELKPSVGKVLNTDGIEIGRHDGAILYTIGERHGFHIFKKEGDENLQKYYVVRKDIQKNILFVSDKLNEGVFFESKLASSGNLILIKKMSFTKDFASMNLADQNSCLYMRVRYRGEKHKVILESYDQDTNILSVRPTEKAIDFAPGQFAVFYCDQLVLGGGELC
jgi:tRNA-specific 2-thiouridylase